MRESARLRPGVCSKYRWEMPGDGGWQFKRPKRDPRDSCDGLIDKPGTYVTRCDRSGLNGEGRELWEDLHTDVQSYKGSMECILLYFSLLGGLFSEGSSRSGPCPPQPMPGSPLVVAVL